MHLSRSQIIWPQSICPGGPYISWITNTLMHSASFKTPNPNSWIICTTPRNPSVCLGPFHSHYQTQTRMWFKFNRRKRSEMQSGSIKTILVFLAYIGVRYHMAKCHLSLRSATTVVRLTLICFKTMKVCQQKNILMDYLDERSRVPSRPFITTNLYLFVHIVFRSWDSPRHCTIQFGGSTLRCIDLHRHIRILKTYASAAMTSYYTHTRTRRIWMLRLKCLGRTTY